jgi:hypothetical protein
MATRAMGVVPLAQLRVRSSRYAVLALSLGVLAVAAALFIAMRG